MFTSLVLAHVGINNRVRSKAVVGLTLLIIYGILFIFAGFRSGIGDTYFYKHTYVGVGKALHKEDLEERIKNGEGIHAEELADVQRILSAQMNIEDEKQENQEDQEVEERTKFKLDGEVGFNLLMSGLNRISPDPQLLIIVTSFLTNLFNLTVLYKYSKPFELGIFLYYATVIFYVTMNGLRQALVASVFFFAQRWIIDRQWKKYFLLIAVLTTFHTSAFLLFPIYFLGGKKAWNKVFWTITAIGILCVTAFKPMMPTIVGILEGSKYNAYAQDMMSAGAGVNIVRVMVMLVPLVLAYMVKDELAKLPKETDFYLYMSLLNFLFILLGTQYLYFYRICIYFELYNLLLIPRIVTCFSKAKANALYVYIIIFYALFCYYQVAIAWGGEKYINVLFA